MIKILVCPDIYDKHIKQLKQLSNPGFEWIRTDFINRNNSFQSELSSAHCIVSRTDLVEEDYKSANNLKLFQLPIAGYDQIDLKMAKKYRIPVANNGGANAISVAEHVFLLMLSIYRHLLIHHNSVVDGSWINLKHSNWELCGKTMGIMGLGKIGKEVAKRAFAFGMNVIYFDIRRAESEFEKEYHVEYKTSDEVLTESDIITYHVPLTSKTEQMINKNSLSLMKPSSVLINTSRGEIQDEEALADILIQEKIFGAGLDVFAKEPLPQNSPLSNLKNVVLTPHAGPSYETQQKLVENISCNINRISVGKQPLNLAVDYEDLDY